MTSHENNEAGDVRGSLRDLLAEATPRPWRYRLFDGNDQIVSLIDGVNEVVIGETYDDGKHFIMDEDADLIVAAINALPDLLDEVDTLRERLAEVWDEALEHVWELADPIGTVDHDDMTPVNTAADLRQAKRENPYRAALSTERGA